MPSIFARRWTMAKSYWSISAREKHFRTRTRASSARCLSTTFFSLRLAGTKRSLFVGRSRFTSTRRMTFSPAMSKRILDQTRKFGLQAVLAHQRIGQLKERGEGIYNAVMGSTQTKIVLGGLADDDAAIMAREMMRGEFNLTKPKPGITMPVVTDEVPFWLESESTSDGHAYSMVYSESSATSDASAQTEGQSAIYDVINQNWSQQSGLTFNAGSTVVSGTSRSTAWAEGHTDSQNRTQGKSQTLKSVREERPTHFYSLEECLHLATLKIRTLPDQARL